MSGPFVDPETLRWLRNQTFRYSYMPGTRFRVDPPSGLFGSYQLRIDSTRLDSNGTGRIMPLRTGISIPPPVVDCRDEGALVRLVAAVLVELEVHESREWFRVDGARHDNPHAGGRT